MGGQLSKDAFFELAGLVADYGAEQPIFTASTALAGGDPRFEFAGSDKNAAIVDTTPLGFARALARVRLPYRPRYPVEATMWLWPTDGKISDAFKRGCVEIAGLQHSIEIMRHIANVVLKPGLCPNFLPLIAEGGCSDLPLLERSAPPALRRAIAHMRDVLLQKQCVPATRPGLWTRLLGGLREVNRERLYSPEAETIADDSRGLLVTDTPLSMHVALTSKPRNTVGCRSLQDLVDAFDDPRVGCGTINPLQFEATILAAAFAVGVMNEVAGVVHNDLTAESVLLDDCSAMPHPLVVYVVGSELPKDLRVFSSETLRWRPMIGNWTLATAKGLPNEALDVEGGACITRGRCTATAAAAGSAQFDLFRLACSLLWRWHPTVSRIMQPYLGTSGIATIRMVASMRRRQCADRNFDRCGESCVYARFNPESEQMEVLSPAAYPFPTPTEFLKNYAAPHFALEYVATQSAARQQYEKSGVVVYAHDTAVVDEVRTRVHNAFTAPVTQRRARFATDTAPGAAAPTAIAPKYEPRYEPRRKPSYEPRRKPGYEPRYEPNAWDVRDDRRERYRPRGNY